jgi:hypothetical protein
MPLGGGRSRRSPVTQTPTIDDRLLRMKERLDASECTHIMTYGRAPELRHLRSVSIRRAAGDLDHQTILERICL